MNIQNCWFLKLETRDWIPKSQSSTCSSFEVRELSCKDELEIVILLYDTKLHVGTRFFVCS